MQVDKRGRVTIPPEVREALKMHPGDVLEVTMENGKAVLESRRALTERLKGCWAADDGRSAVDELIVERRAEAAADEAAIERAQSA